MNDKETLVGWQKDRDAMKRFSDNGPIIMIMNLKFIF